MMRLESDLFALCNAAIDGRLQDETIAFSPKAALAVVMAAGGYPGEYKKGEVISGLDDVSAAKVFHAGTAVSDNEVVTSGGRILAVTALGDSITEAQRIAYEETARIRFKDSYQRSDIGYRAVARER